MFSLKTRFSESELSNSSRKVVKNEIFFFEKNRLVIIRGIFIFPTFAKFPEEKKLFCSKYDFLNQNSLIRREKWLKTKILFWKEIA